jgi:hypothetical protein
MLLWESGCRSVPSPLTVRQCLVQGCAFSSNKSWFKSFMKCVFRPGTTVHDPSSQHINDHHNDHLCTSNMCVPPGLHRMEHLFDNHWLHLQCCVLSAACTSVTAQARRPHDTYSGLAIHMPHTMDHRHCFDLDRAFCDPVRPTSREATKPFFSADR